MTDTSYHEPFLKLMRDFSGNDLPVDLFCTEFTNLWMQNRDLVYAKKATWSQPYDELIIAAWKQGEISDAQFKQQFAELWGYADDVGFEDIISPLHSACSCWRPLPELEGEIDEAQLRQEVKDALASYQSLKPLAQTAQLGLNP